MMSHSFFVVAPVPSSSEFTTLRRRAFDFAVVAGASSLSLLSFLPLLLLLLAPLEPTTRLFEDGSRWSLLSPEVAAATVVILHDAMRSCDGARRTCRFLRAAQDNVHVTWSFMMAPEVYLQVWEACNFMRAYRAL